MIRVILFGIFVVLFILGIIKLQIILSQKPNKWLGLILPGTSLLISIVTVGLIILGVAVYTGSTLTKGSVLTQDGIVEQSIFVEGASIHSESVTYVSVMGVILSAGLAFLLCNVPTAVLLAIYAANRDKRQKNNELARMNIQDLN